MPLASLFVLAGLILFVGWRLPSRRLAWITCVAGVVAAHWITLDELALSRMVALVAILLFGMKSLVYAEYRQRGKPAVPLLYFLIQGILVSVTNVRGTLPALLCVAVPTPILFHPQFIDQVIIPILPL